MAKVKIVTVIGARPQFIKLSALSPLLRKSFKEVVVHTGQHFDREMSANFFHELNLPAPDYNLGVSVSRQGEQVGRMLVGIEKVLIKERPHLVIIYGDTNSTLAGALAAAKLNILVAHIEAGLRSFRNSMPEEQNRVLADHLSGICFCPTKNAVLNLKKEGITANVYNVGDLMLDALRFYSRQAQIKSLILSRLKICSGQYFLATIHRAENTNSKERLKQIMDILGSLKATVIFPVHPRTKKAIARYGIAIKTPRIQMIRPVSYFDILKLQANAKAILTDSGGVQKEAYFLNVPCVTLREETEWIETVRGGSNFITGLDKDKITKLLKKLHDRKIQNNLQFFGDGKAARKISAILKRKLNGFYS